MRETWDADACLVAAILMLVLAPVLAAGDDSPVPAAPAANGLTIERLPSGFVVTPDVKLSEVDGEFASLAGAQLGWMTDRTLFVGFGGYWLTGGERDRELAYGGGVVEWALRGDRRLGFGARALIGGGSTTLSRPNDAPPLHRSLRGIPDPDWSRGAPSRGSGILQDGFFVAEPQLNVLWRAADWLRVGAGVGYRLIGTEDSVADRLRGVSGSVSLQIGGGT